MGTRRGETPVAVKKIGRWVRSRTVREKVVMGTAAAFITFLFLMFCVKDHFIFFIPSRFAHAAGLLILLYKLHISKTCAGLSLKSQELTAIYLVARFVCSIKFQRDIHILLDLVTLGASLWVIYMMRVKLKSTYMQELDNMPLHYVLVPCAIAAILAHPRGSFDLYLRFLWPFSMAVEAIAVLPQLHLIQNAKMVEPFTSHYVFALGVSRFFQFAYWLIQIINSRGTYLLLVGHGHFWILLRGGSDFYLGRLLLLLYQKCHGGEALNEATIYGLKVCTCSLQKKKFPVSERVEAQWHIHSKSYGGRGLLCVRAPGIKMKNVLC